MDERTRPEHAEWHGTILAVDDPWWDTHYPPCGWNCRCTVIQLDADTIADRGWAVSDAPPNAGPPVPYTNPRTGEVVDVPAGIDPGFAYNVGKSWLGGIMPSPLPEPLLPELEPGVAPAPHVPAGAPEPATLLDVNVSESEAVQAFLNGIDPAPVATLVGDEIAPADAGMSELRDAAGRVLDAMRADPPVSPRLGAMRVGTKGKRKMLNMSHRRQRGARRSVNELALRATPAIGAVVRNGTVEMVPTIDPANKPDVLEYARHSAPIEIAGERHDMTVVSEHYSDGWAYYYHELEVPSGRPIKSGVALVDEGPRSADAHSDPKIGDRSPSYIAGRDAVVTDDSGWPLPAGEGWFRDAGGALIVPAGDRRRVLGLVGRAIAAPSQIRLRWVTGADGAPMVFRRYIAKVDGLAMGSPPGTD